MIIFVSSSPQPTRHAISNKSVGNCQFSFHSVFCHLKFDIYLSLNSSTEIAPSAAILSLQVIASNLQSCKRFLHVYIYFCIPLISSASVCALTWWARSPYLHPPLATTFCSGREFVNLRNIIYKWVIGGKNKQLIINSMLLMRSGHATGS